MREHGQYGEAHLFFAVPLPYSRLDADIFRLAPRKSVRVVVCDDDGEKVAPAAARRLSELGYTHVQVLQGGTAAWKRAGYVLFAGVNLPSKAFGELAEQVYHTPRVSATELAAMLARKEDVVVLDGRPVAEFQKMNIPTATCCPNGELAYRVQQLVPNPTTRIVINCAGRTRSIIGAQTLINLGLRNPVSALENGTQGWYLEDLTLEHGNTRHYGEPAGQADMRAAARQLAQRFDVPMVDADTVRGWALDPKRSLFLCDVRTPEEFARGSLPGAQHTPGGQLMQSGDQYVGVRHARVVLFDADGIRAPTVASWLRQMGFDACVLAQGMDSGLALAPLHATPVPNLPGVGVAGLVEQIAQEAAMVIDVRPSMQFRKGHIPGSKWSIRPLFAQSLSGERRPIVLVGDDPGVLAGAANELERLGLRAQLLTGGFAAWCEAGHSVQAAPDCPPDSACIDFLFFVHDRHDGNKQAARQYLAWETNLIGQLDPQELQSFRLPVSPL